MPSFKLCDAEFLALLDEPGDLLKVYCEIRRHMNFDNSVSGVNNHPGGKRFNERAFLELLEVPSSPGRAKAKASRAKVRHYLDRLEKLGLVARRGPLVFHLPLATSPLSDPERYNQRHNQNSGEVQPKRDPIVPSDSAQSSHFGSEGTASQPGEVQPEVQPTTGVTGITPTPDGVGESTAANFPPCPHQQILALWNEYFPQHRQPLANRWDSSRTGYQDLARRWREGFSARHSQTGKILYTDVASGIQWWRDLFAWIQRSWLINQDQFRGFCLDWMVKRSNWDKIMEGAYHDQ